MRDIDDFRISGATASTFVDAAGGLLRLADRTPVERLTIVTSAETREAVFAGGASVAEVSDAVRSGDLGDLQRLDAWFRPTLDGTEARVALAVARDRTTLIDGMLYLDHLVRHAADPSRAIAALGAWLAAAADALDGRLLGIAREDVTDDAVDSFGRVLAPYLLAIVPRVAAAPLRHRFDGTGVELEDRGAQTLIWLLSPAAWIAGGEPTAAARSEVAALAAGAVPG